MPFIVVVPRGTVAGVDDANVAAIVLSPSPDPENVAVSVVGA